MKKNNINRLPTAIGRKAIYVIILHLQNRKAINILVYNLPTKTLHKVRKDMQSLSPQKIKAV